MKRAESGAKATEILRESFPGSTLARVKGVTVKVLVADLAPQAVLSGRTALRLVDEGNPAFTPVGLLPDHRHLVTRTRGGIAVRDLDNPRARAVGLKGPVRIDSGVAETGIRMAEPLDRRYRGSLRLARSDGASLMVVNELGIEAYLQGVLPGEMPPSVGRRAQSALEAVAVAARSRVIARMGQITDPRTFQLTADEPLYLGLDGERPATNRAVKTSRGLAVTFSRRAFEASFPVVPGTAPVAFVPDPGDPDPVAEGPARPVKGAKPGLGPAAFAAVQSFLGTPYVWGGSRPGGFDCSGLMYYVFQQLGITIPRVAEDQARAGYPVPREQLRPGDLVFFADSSGYIGHMGMYAGGGRMIHAPQTGDVVKYTEISTGRYAQRYAGARRISP